MIVRQLVPDDVREHRKVAAQAYSYGCDLDDKSATLPKELVLGAFLDDNKTLMADMVIGERECFFGNGTLKCATVGGVASKPEFRGRGAVKAVYKAFFESTKADISILYPFSIAYYSQFGYESAGRYMTLTVPFSEFSAIKRNSDAVLFEGENVQDLLAMYNRFAQQNSLSFLRENADNFSSEPYKNSTYTYVWDNRSYATFRIDKPNKTLYVIELGFIDKASLCGILGFLKNYQGNLHTVVFEKLPMDSPVVNLIYDEKKTQQTCASIGSVRILNVENVLKTHSYPMESGSFTVKIEDSVQRNNSTFEVKYANGTAEVIRDSTEKPDLVMNINAASRVLLSGVNKKNELEYIGGAEICGDLDAFLRAMPKNEPFFYDQF